MKPNDRPDGFAGYDLPDPPSVITECIVSNVHELRRALRGKINHIYVVGQINFYEDEYGNSFLAGDLLDRYIQKINKERLFSKGYKLYDTYSELYSSWRASLKEHLPSENYGNFNDMLEEYNIHWPSQLFIGSQTSIIGRTPDAAIIGGQLIIQDSSDVSIRNLAIIDKPFPFSVFKKSNPLKGYCPENYGVLVKNSSHVWIDRCTFRTDYEDPEYIPLPDGTTVKYLHISPALRTTKNSNYITVSDCEFINYERAVITGRIVSREESDASYLTFERCLFKGCMLGIACTENAKLHILNCRFMSGENSFRMWAACRCDPDSDIIAEGNVIDPDVMAFFKGAAYAVKMTGNICGAPDVSVCTGEGAQKLSLEPYYVYSALDADRVADAVSLSGSGKNGTFKMINEIQGEKQ